MIASSLVARIGCKSNSIGKYMTRKRHLSLSPTSRLNINTSAKMSARESSLCDGAARIEYQEVPVKSASDKKEYRSIVLGNGLRALLISDPSPKNEETDEQSDADHETASESESETSTNGSDMEESQAVDEEKGEKLAAAALCIGVGSFSDPKKIPGLAHFLEHMIFMGSIKYPQENEYDAYINKCGGFDNAMTDLEETTFYFEIDEQYLDGALDRFSNLFTSPLMLRDSICRERDAVESEFQTNINSDDSRREQLMASLGIDEHPCSSFTWGNLKTLKDGISDDELYENVHKFQQKHYSAHRMTFAIQARMPLDELEDLTKNYFSSIPNNNLPQDDFSQFTDKNAFKSSFYDKVFFVKPKSNICRLDVTWCLPPSLKKYKCKAIDYISYLFGHEGKNSLTSFLRKNMWALDVHTGASYGFEKNSLYTLFSVSINMTDYGFEHVDDILKAIFSYVKLLKQEGPVESLYEELKDIEATSFRFRKEKEATDNVEELVVNMRYYPSEDIITGSELYFEYDEAEIQEVIDQLNESRFNIMISSSKLYDGIAYDKVEKWFGTEYTEIDLPEKWSKMWKEAQILPELKLPLKNPYISTNFDILDHNIILQYPEKIFENDVCELWFKQDNKFLLPLTIMQFYIITPLAIMDPVNATLTSLYTSMLKFQLAEDLFPAEIAGLCYEIYSSEKGIVLKVEGYSEKLPIIVDEITKAMRQFNKKLNHSIFEAIKKKLCKAYYNEMIKSEKLSRDMRLKVVQKTHWSTIEKFNILKNLTSDDLKRYSEILFNEVKVQTLIQGNILKANANKIMMNVLNNLKCGEIKNKSMIELRANQIPLGDNHMSMKTFRTNDVNSVTTNFYQIGPMTPQIIAKLELMVMLIEEPLFDLLRTKEQLGYDISTVVRDNHGILGYSITIHSQENKFNYEHIDSRIEFFNNKIIEILEEMSLKDFSLVQNSLFKRKQIVDTELKNEVSRNWVEITTEEYIFDRNKREMEYIKNLTQSNIIEFYKKIMFEDRRKLSVQVIGNSTEVSEAQSCGEDSELVREFDVDWVEPSTKSNTSNYINDVEKFRNGLFTYPVTKSKFD